MDLVGLDQDMAGATRISCPAASSSGSGWPAPSPPTRRSCSWTSIQRRRPDRPGHLQDELTRLQGELHKTVVLVTTTSRRRSR